MNAFTPIESVEPAVVPPDGMFLSLWKGLIPARQTKAQIKASVAADWDLTVADLEGPSQKHRIAHPRQEAMWRMRQVRRPSGEHRYSLFEIGQCLGGRDHTTVRFGIAAHQARLDAMKLEEAA